MILVVLDSIGPPPLSLSPYASFHGLVSRNLKFHEAAEFANPKSKGLFRDLDGRGDEGFGR
jgi:hypothetical protein